MLKTILLLLPPVFILLLAILAVQNNRIPGNLGMRQGRLAPLPASPNAVSSQTDSSDRRVAPLPFSGDLQQTRTALLRAIGRYPGAEGKSSPNTADIHPLRFQHRTIWASRMMWNSTSMPERELIHFRSASRVGYSDMGLNRKRYHTLASLYLRED